MYVNSIDVLNGANSIMLHRTLLAASRASSLTKVSTCSSGEVKVKQLTLANRSEICYDQ